MTKQSTCPPTNLLEEFVGGKLTDPQLGDLAKHLEDCASCQGLAKTLSPHDTLVESLRAKSVAADAISSDIPRPLMEKLKHLSQSPASSDTIGVNIDSVPGGSDAELNFLTPAQQPDEIGRLGHYRILKVLGKGGMGVVFLADDPKLDRQVALKAMLPKIAANPTAKDRFKREARAAAKLKSDHIVTIYQVDEVNGIPFLAMELLEGKPLDDYIRDGRTLTIEQILRIGRDVAKGLAAAHEKGLIHRDIKPANLWLDPTNGGRVKILDFGLARSQKDDVHLTQSGTIVGTPAFMAPEQAHGEKDVDGRADLFSLGCVLYRLCVGDIPFKSETTMGMLLAIATKHPTAPITANPKIPQALSDLTMQLLDKDPVKRPASAREVITRINEIERSLSARTSQIEVKQPAAARAPLSATEESTKLSEITPAATPSATAAPAKPRGGLGWFIAPAIALLLLGGGAFGVYQLFFNTPNGRIVVQIDDDDIEARFKKGKIELYDKAGKLLYTLEPSERNKNLPPGNYGIKVAGVDGLELDTDKFEMKRGGKVIVRILLDRDALAKKDVEIKHVKDVPPAKNKFALEFDGQTTHVEIPTLTRNEPGPITLEAFVTPSRSSTGVNLIRLSGKYFCQIHAWANGPEKSLIPNVGYNGGKLTGTSRPHIPMRQPTHIAAQIDDKHVEIFIDGKPYDKAPYTPKLFDGDPGPSLLGCFKDPGKAPTWFFAGILSEVRISKTLRYQGPFTPKARFSPDADTLALYHMDDGQGDKLTDSSGNGHHGKIVGAKWIATHRDDPRPDPAGPFVLKFDEKSRVTVPTLYLDLHQPMTLEGFVTQEGRGQNTSLFGMNLINIRGGVKTTWSIHYRPENSPTMTFAQTDIAVQNGKRTHVAVVVANDTLRFFVDGVLALQKDNKEISLTKNKQQLEMGFGFTGVISEVRVSKTARYDKNFTPARRLTPDADTLALYHMDDGQGEKLTDSSGNGHHGKIVGAKWVKADGSAVLPSNFALSFEGEGKVTFPPFDIKTESSHTLELVVTPRDAKGNDRIAGLDGVVSLFASAKEWGFYAQQGGVFSPIDAGRSPTHLAIVSSGTQRRCYVNGKLVRTTNDVKPTLDAKRLLTIGGSLNAVIREVRLSNTARYGKDFIPAKRHEPDADTLALYHFDEGQGDVLTDSSGNGHHGKIVGAKWVKADGTLIEAPVQGGNFALELTRDDTKNVILPDIDLDPNGPATIEAYCVHGDKQGTLLGIPRLNISSSPAKWALQAGAGVPGNSGRPFKRGERVHLAAVRTNDAAMLFVDGKLVDRLEGLSDKSILKRSYIHLGWGLTGTVQEVRISKVARYDKDFTPQKRFEPDAHTVALYHCDEGAGDKLTDSSGNGHHGKIVGAKWVNADGTPAAGNVVYLDDLPETLYDGSESLGKHGKNFKGEPIVWKEEKLAHALFIHPKANTLYAAVEYDLGGRFDMFTAQVGLTLIPNRKLTFRVKGDGKTLWELTDYDTPFVKNNVAVSVRDVKVLRLEVTGGFSNAGTTWLNPQVTQRGAKEIKTSPTKFTNPLGMEFVLVPKGKSWLGGGNGKPGDKVVEMKDDFYLGVYEVTQEEWEKVMGSNPSYFALTGGGKNIVKKFDKDVTTKRFPVDSVSWDDCQKFLAKLNEQTKETGWVYRLPTEVEWEYACRGGPMTAAVESEFDFYLDLSMKTLPDWQANFDFNPGYKRTAKVGGLRPNKLGLYDMHGNVWEWCDDRMGEGAARRVVVRGGSWQAPAQHCRAAYRDVREPWAKAGFNGTGLRVARVRVSTASTIPSGTPQRLTTLQNFGPVHSLAFSPDWDNQPRFLISVGEKLTFLDLRKESPKNPKISGAVLHEEKAFTLARMSLSADRKTLALSGIEGKMFATRVMELPGRKTIAEFNPKYIQLGGALSPDGTTLVYGDEDGLIFRDVRAGKAELAVKAVKDHLYTGIKFSSDGRYVTAIHYDNRNPGNGMRLVILNARTRATIATKDIEGPAGTSDISHDSKSVVVVGGTKNGKPAWYSFSLPEGNLVHVEENLPDVCASAALSPVAAHLALGFRDGTVQIWDLAAKRMLLSWNASIKIADPKASSAVSTLAFSPDGKMLATSSSTGGIQMWDLTQEAAVVASVDLLKDIDTKRDAVEGNWSIVDNKLVTPKGAWNRLMIATPPPQEYQIDMVLERKNEERGMNLGFVMGGKQCLVVIDGFGAEGISGLETVDGKQGNNNATTYRGQLLPLNKPTAIVLQVRKNEVTFQCEGKTIFRWQGDPARLGVFESWRVPNGKVLFLGSQGVFHVQKMTLTPLGPKNSAAIGSFAPPAAAPDFALAFDGGGGFKIPMAKYERSKPLTVEAWVNPGKMKEINASHFFLNVGECASLVITPERDWGFAGRETSKKISFEIGSFPLKPQLKRTHVAGVRDAKEVRLYINGLLVKKKTLDAPILGFDDFLTVGTHQRNFVGVLDEIRVSSVVRYTKDFTPSERFDADGDTLALYHCDEGTGDFLKDSSGNAHHGKISNAKWVKADGVPLKSQRYALEFTDDNPSRPQFFLSKASIDRAKPFTVEGYFTVMSPKGRSTLGLFDLTGAPRFTYVPVWTWGYEYLVDGKKTLAQVRSTVEPVLHRRVHLAGVRTADKLLLFVDGKLLGSTEVPPGTLTGKTGVFFGGTLIGTMDQVRISSVARYDKDFTPPPELTAEPGTESLYLFKEGKGDTVEDASGNGHHGKIVGAKWVKADGTPVPDGGPAVPGPFTAALAFDGEKSHVTIPTLERNTHEPITLEAWVRPRVGGQKNAMVMARISGKAPCQIHFWGQLVGLERTLTEKNLGVVHELYGGYLKDMSSWMHVAYVIDAKEARMYVNGKTSGRFSGKGRPAPYTPPSVPGTCIGAELPGYFFHGELAGFRFSKTARYTKDFTPTKRFESDKDTLALYHFDEGQGDKLTDSSGNGHHGKIVGAKWVKAEGMAINTPTKVTNPLGMEFVLVPKGKAWLGGFAGKPGDREFEVQEDFYLGAYEVTQEEWEKVMGKNPSNFHHNGSGKSKEAVKDVDATELKRFPVEGVSWNDCQEFIARLNEKFAEPGWVYRLPTATEWEYACRGGPMKSKEDSAFDFYVGEPGNSLSSKLANIDNVLKRPCKVGSYPPNRLGLFDMHGNVHEFCGDALVEGSTTRRITRGGCFDNPAKQAVARDQNTGAGLTSKAPMNGLRVARVRVSAKEPAFLPIKPASKRVALDFDGISSRVDIPTLSRDEDEPITLEAFITPSRAKGGILVRMEGKYPCQLYGWPAPGSTTDWVPNGIDHRGLKFKQGTPAIIVGKRQHLVLQIGNTKMELFIDGTKVNSISRTSGGEFKDVFRGAMLGAQQNPTRNFSDFFAGTIHQIRISKVLRYSGDFQPTIDLKTDKVTLALYHFDEGQGDKLTDSSGNGHHGKIVGAKWVKADGTAIARARDYGLEFDGEKSHVLIPSLGRNDGGPMTLEAYVTPSRFKSHQMAVHVCGHLPITLGHLGRRWRGNVHMETAAPAVLSEEAKAKLGEQAHVAAVWDGKQLRLYVDGRLSEGERLDLPAGKGPGGSVGKGGDHALIGAVGKGGLTDELNYHFAGIIHEVRISKVARYDRNFLPAKRFTPDKDTLALYHFDEGEGELLKDSSGNGHDGKIVGAKWVKVEGTASPAVYVPVTPEEKDAQKLQQDWAVKLKHELELKSPSGILMVLIPPGGEAVPKPYLLGKYEVTQDEWEAVMGYNPSYFDKSRPEVQGLKLSRFPVEQVSWFDSVEFCNKLSEKEGLKPYYALTAVKRIGKQIVDARVKILGGDGYRIPTETEWEHGCRAGTKTAYPSEKELMNHAWFEKNSEKRPHPVGEKAPNAFGLYDMYGNLREWNEEMNRTDKKTGAPERTTRGGSWSDDAGNCSVRSLYGYAPEFRRNGIGLRLARNPLSVIP